MEADLTGQIDETVDRWLQAQAIGLSAYALGAYSAVNNSVAQLLYGQARVHFHQFLEDETWQTDMRMQDLPASVLGVLASVDDVYLSRKYRSRIQPAAQRALNILAPQNDSPLALAEILAHHIMYGSGSANRIARFAISLVDRPAAKHALVQWERNESFQNFSSNVETLRKPGVDVEERLKAIASLAGTPLPFGKQIQNILIQHAFAWPLLVCTCAAFSLPVAIDVEMKVPEGYRERVRVEGNALFDLRLVPLDQNGLRARSWLDNLLKSRDAAGLLWAKAHGNCGRFRKQVRYHQAIFDFAWASRIVELAFGLNGSSQAFPLEGSSATAYFTQVVLARLLGKRWYLSSAVTGAIGARVAIPRKHGAVCEAEEDWDRDFWLERVHDVRVKYGYVRATRSFERFVAPTGNEEDIAAAKLGETNGDNDWSSSGAVHVTYHSKLSGVADVVQVEGWRKTNFIRCPEVAEVVHGDGHVQFLIANRHAVSGVRASIALHDRSVLWMPSKPAVAACAVSEINQLLHEEAAKRLAVSSATFKPGVRNVRREQGHIAPGLSWCVIRAIEEEQDASFWRTLWRIIGAPVADFETFRDSATRGIAASRLAEALNRHTPDELAPSHRAPDIFVVIGLEKFSKGMKTNKTPLARPLAVIPLLQELNDRNLLEPSPYRRRVSYLKEMAGIVRFVVVPETDEDPLPPSDVILTDAEQRAIVALSTFRFGFSQQMAAMLLSDYGIEGENVRQLLLELKKKNALRYVSGQFFITQTIKQKYGAANGDEAMRHKAAGIALAPYTTAASVSGLAYDTAFLPENVKEAQVHLWKAYRLYGISGNSKMQRMVKPWFQRVCRFASVPDWSAVGWLNKARLGKDAYELAEELIVGWREHGGNTNLPPHPTQYIAVIEAVTYYPDFSKSLQVAKEAYARGLDACTRYGNEAVFCELQLAATFSMFLYRRYPTMIDEMREADRRVWSHRQSWDNVRGDWFEKNGDSCGHDDRAAWHYWLGVLHAPQYRQNWVKNVGARMLARLPITEVLERLNDQRSQNGSLELTRSFLSFQPNKSEPRPHVSRRWTAGAVRLGSMLATP